MSYGPIHPWYSASSVIQRQVLPRRSDERQDTTLTERHRSQSARSDWAQKVAFRLHHTVLGLILGLGEVCWVSKRIRWHANCIEPSHDPANIAAPFDHEDPMERNSKHLEAHNNRVDPPGKVNELRIPPKYCQ